METDKSRNLQSGQLQETQESQYSSLSLLDNFLLHRFFFYSSRPSTDGMWPTYIVRQSAYSLSVSLNAIQKHPQRNTWNNHVPSQLKKKICHRGNFSKDLQYSQDLLAERRVDHHILGELKWLGFSLKPVAGYGPKKRRRKGVEL